MNCFPDFLVGGVVRGEFILKKPSDGVTPVDANSTPSVVVAKNGTDNLESVTVSAISGVTGGYRLAHTPADATEGDLYTYRITSPITDAAFSGGSAFNHIEICAARCKAVERGTNSAYTGTPPTAVQVRQEMDTNSTGLAAIYARQGAPAGASQSADIAAIKTDTGNLVTRITSTLFSGITYMSRWLGALAGKTADAGTLAEITATTAGTSYDNTTDSLQAIKDTGTSGGDASQTTLLAVKAKTDLIGSAQANVALTAAAVIDIGSITGFPTTLTIGDSYDSNSGEIEVTILDADGDLLTAIGDLLLSDATIEFTAFRTGDPASMHLSGTCTYVASIVSITLPSSVTSLGKADFTYEGRLKFTWSADDAQKTFKTTQFKFIENP